MQHGEEHGAFQRKAVLAFARQLRDHCPAAGLLPQPLEHQPRPDPARGNLHCSFIAGRAQHHGLGRKSRARAQQPLELAARLQFLETPERRDHLLADLIAVAAALDDLQIGASGRGLAAKVHDGLRVLVRTKSRDLAWAQFWPRPRRRGLPDRRSSSGRRQLGAQESKSGACRRLGVAPLPSPKSDRTAETGSNQGI